MKLTFAALLLITSIPLAVAQGTYTQIDVPGETGTACTGIDAAGEAFTNVNFPGSNQTELFAINNAGFVVGTAAFGEGRQAPFELAQTYRRIVPPGHFTSAAAVGINNANTIAVDACYNGQCTNFLFAGGRFRPLQIHLPHAEMFGFNDTDAVVGAYGEGAELTTGFLLQNGTLQSFTFPGASVTIAYGINNSGVVVGYFFDASGSHGFTWTPAADSTKK